MNDSKFEKWFNTGLTLLAEEGASSAFDYFEEGLNKKKGFRFWANKGIGLARMKMENYVLAMGDFKRAIEINPNDASLWKNIGYCQYQLKHLQEAINSYEKAIEFDKNDDNIWYTIGIIHNQQKNFNKAKEAIEKTLNLNRKNSRALNMMGDILINQAKYEEALKHYQELLQLNKKNRDAWSGIGGAKFYLEDFIGAEKAYRKALEFNPSDSSILYNIGETLCKQGKFQDSEEYFEKSIVNDPSLENSWQDLAGVYEKLGYIEKSVYLLLWYNRILNLGEKRNKEAVKIKNIFPIQPQFLSSKPGGWYELLKKVIFVSENQDAFNYELGDVIYTIKENEKVYREYYDTNMTIKTSLFEEDFNNEILEKALASKDPMTVRAIMAKIKMTFMSNIKASQRIVMVRSGPRLLNHISGKSNVVLINTFKKILPELARSILEIDEERWEEIIKGNYKCQDEELTKILESLKSLANSYWDIDQDDIIINLHNQISSSQT